MALQISLNSPKLYSEFTPSLFHFPSCILYRPSHLFSLKTAPKPCFHYRTPATVVAVRSTVSKVIQTAWRVGKDGLEAGTNLVPDSVPRPIARIGVAVLTLTLSLYVLKSLLSTAFFVLAMMGLIYFVFIALNKDEGPGRGGGGGGGDGTSSTDETLEEARRIMEKYRQ
ncbi:hypothetical protein AMTRI_Chr07g27000 [Amborella trichopoda]|uniref:uncharacterized protein LOC18426027 n=1 Tax=Amborella trichopoda TaxID=13333 RepID=UPI0005D3782E|nr:uncharacterized protein LOC18426027 [Amborella trichopoda]|eukprot:XP_011620359.1 uncharacterized protein LOC18426027 [Amborella trichopoda]